MTLGDVIDWGPDSRGVIDQMIELSEECNLISLLGNHEEMLLYAHRSSSEFQNWMHSGGDKTLESYGPRALCRDIPDAHLRFLKSFRPFHETETHIFVHANYCWYSRMEEQSPSLLRWISIEESMPKAHLSGKTVVLGHAPGALRDYGFCRCIDTGCGFGGQLTAIDVTSGDCWQVNEGG